MPEAFAATDLHDVTFLPIRCSRRQLLSAARAEGNLLYFYFPMTSMPPVGSSVNLQVTLTDSTETLNVFGNVSSHRRVQTLKGPESGIELNFGGEAKRLVAQMLARCAGRPQELGTARTARVGKNLDCSIQLGSRTLAGFVRDLSPSGAFIAAPQITKLRVGTSLYLKLRAGMFGLTSQTLEARVVWFGSKAGTTGFGARFVGDPKAVGDKLRKHL